MRQRIEELEEALRPLMEKLEEANAHDSRCLTDEDYENLVRARDALRKKT